MTVEALRAYHELDSGEQEAEQGHSEDTFARDIIVLVGAAGQNAAHMAEALGRLQEEHPIHAVDIRPPEEVAYDEYHDVSTPEGQESVRRLMGGGAVHAVYLSLVPSMHLSALDEYLGYVGEGLADFVVIPKPGVQNMEEMFQVDELKEQAEARLREMLGTEDLKPILYIHEHYNVKSAWKQLRERLPEAANILGRLHTTRVSIEEARTAEDEGRIAAFAGGALEDFGPHVISLGLGVKSSINDTDRYEISGTPKTTMERSRYQDSELPEGVETSFIIHGTIPLTDKEDPEGKHEVRFVWSGGKGLVDKKEAVLEFVHPDTGEHSRVTVDLRTNTLSVPESVQHLFSETQPHDNGYGYAIEAGLNGGDPRESFQDWSEVRIVTKTQEFLARRAITDPRLHAPGVSVLELVS